jgi:hypothetical protein
MKNIKLGITIAILTSVGYGSSCFGELTLLTFSEGSVFISPSSNSEIIFSPPSKNIEFVASLQSTENEGVTENETINQTSNLPLFTGKLLNFPNPFSMRTGTRIGYQLNQAASIELRIYSIAGYLFFQKTFSPTEEGGINKYNRITIDSSTLNGAWLSPGVYIYVILGNGKVLAKNKMVVTP